MRLASLLEASKQRSAATSSRQGYTRYRSMPVALQIELAPLLRQSASMALAGELGGRELANVLEVSGDEQFRSTILMLKLFETNTRSALREIHAKLDLLAQGPRSTGAAVHASIYRYVLHVDICYYIYHEYVCVYVYIHI